MGKVYYTQRHDLTEVPNLSGSLTLETPKYEPGDMLRVFVRTKSGQMVEIVDEYGELIWAIYQERNER